MGIRNTDDAEAYLEMRDDILSAHREGPHRAVKVGHTLTQAQRTVSAHYSHYLDPDTLRYFKARVLAIYGQTYLVESYKLDPDGPRMYRVVWFELVKETDYLSGERSEDMTREQAHRLAKRFAARFAA